MAVYGYPEVYGIRPDGHCGHCNGIPEACADSIWGIFCLECYRWRTYTGPKQWWGDGMNVTQTR